MRQPGGLAQKVLINVQVAQLLSGQIGTVAVNAISMVVYVSVMVLYSVPLTLVGIGRASINLLVLWLVARLQVVANQRLQQAQVLQSAQAFTGISLYVMSEAVRHGAPAPVLTRMGLNIAADTAVGAIPVIGFLFDMAFKANTRNLNLLRQHLAETHR